MGGEAKAHVRIATHETRGKVLLATAGIPAGQTVIRDDPLIIAPPSRRPVSSFFSEMHELDFIRAFEKQNQSIKDKILDLYSPTDGLQADALRKKYSGKPVHRSIGITQESLELFVKVAMVFKFNAVNVNPAFGDGSPGASPSLGTGLYEMACRLNHSCSPNCCWYASQDGARIVRTLVPVAEGEELTIDYHLESKDTAPVHVRRTRLENSWGFLCECQRCSAFGDDTRRLHCTNSACKGGHHLVHQPTDEDVAALTPCSLCGTQPSAHAAKRMLRQEGKLLKELDRAVKDLVFTLCDPDDVAVLRIQPPHPHHYLARKVNLIQYEFQKKSEEPEKAAEALMRAIDCREAIIPFPSRKTAFFFEYCGDMLYQSACSSGASTKSLTARNNLMDAQRVYRNALQMLLLVAGPSHPYSSCVSRKLLAVQSRLPAEAVALGPEVCNLCGGKEVPHYDSVTTLRAQQEGEIKALPRCGRCRNVAYCCPEHQRAQWRLHKAACRAPPAPPDETK